MFTIQDKRHSNNLYQYYALDLHHLASGAYNLRR